LVALLSAVVLLAVGAAAASAQTVVADSGFRPNPDGFSFENYGSDPGYANLSSAEMVKLFGNGVCANTSKKIINEPAPAPASPSGVILPPKPSKPSQPSGPSEGRSGHSEPPGDAAADTNSFSAFTGAAGTCVLTPDAQQWMDTQNAGMGGGHCYGFAVLASELWKGQFHPFGQMPTYSNDIVGNTSLQRSIAYAFVYQVLDSVATKMIQGITPNKMLDKIISVLSTRGPETWTLGIYKADGSGGHAVTPFQVVKLDGGLMGVNIYNNNNPGETHQIVFDTNKNTWSYNASPNPSIPPELYSGSATNPQLDLSPTTPGEGVQPATFGKAGGSLGHAGGGAGSADGLIASAASRVDTVQLVGNLHYHAHLVIRGTGAQQVGVVNGAIVNTFPGAIVKPTLAFDDYTSTQEPTYLIPARAVTITIDGSHLQHNDTEMLSDVGDGQSLSIKNLKIGPGQKDVLDLMHGTADMTFTAAKGRGSGSPVFHIGADTSKSNVALSLKMVNVRPGSTVHIKVNEAKQLITFYSTNNKGSGTFVLSAVKETKKANYIEGSDTVRLHGNESVTYSYAK
jgi:hypothetical protein